MKKSLFSLLFVFLLILAPSVQAETAVSPDKVWTITFNTPVDLDSVKEAVKVDQFNGGWKTVKVEYGDNKKQVKVTPSNGPYEEGIYELQVGYRVKSLDGVWAQSRASKVFSVGHPEWSSDYQSMKEIKVEDLRGGEVNMHLLADQPLPEKTDSTKWSDQSFEAKFALGVQEANGLKRVVNLPILEEGMPVFYQNEDVNVDWQFRKIDDRLFVVTQMINERFTTDYYFAVVNGVVKRVQFSAAKDGLENERSRFYHQSDNTYVQRVYSELFQRDLEAKYVLDTEFATFHSQKPLTQRKIHVKARYLQDKVRNMIYSGLEKGWTYNQVEHNLDPYVTDRLKPVIKQAYQNACLDCGQKLFNKDWQFEIKSTVLENFKDRAIVQTFVPDTGETYGGIDWIELKHEEGRWKLDGVTTAYFSKDVQLDLTMKQSKEYLENLLPSRVKHLKSYHKEVKDYQGVSYTTEVHLFQDFSTYYEVDASTGIIEILTDFPTE
ncbi:Ig-like domain-containing protein [Halobacillus litoralis]|uniref:Ig-like domain-containing protein n=1 Tax=Halobacillus litoralis TaxID=45668 RepID=UPI001CD5211F|nr:Ig-like domain-containing protein [Halobacillus litoralis]MCA0970951.1 Ig-like domain-containing protein [Halobacillus litoralis]